jgi:hypothetical protein
MHAQSCASLAVVPMSSAATGFASQDCVCDPSGGDCRTAAARNLILSHPRSHSMSPQRRTCFGRTSAQPALTAPQQPAAAASRLLNACPLHAGARAADGSARADGVPARRRRCSGAIQRWDAAPRLKKPSCRRGHGAVTGHAGEKAALSSPQASSRAHHSFFCCEALYCSSPGMPRHQRCTAIWPACGQLCRVLWRPGLAQLARNGAPAI